MIPKPTPGARSALRTRRLPTMPSYALDGFTGSGTAPSASGSDFA